METQITAMPEMDWLTGLSSRAAFGRQVGQADRDRDRFAIALIEIQDFGEINRQLDYETGDELLRTIGQALAFQTSVNTFAARLGGAQFAVLTVQRLSDDLQGWIGPIVSAVKAAIGTWTFDQIDFTGDCAIEPEVRVGAAAGYSSRVWSDAAMALDLAQSDPQAGPAVLHDGQDPRFVSRSRQQIMVDRISRALTDDTLRSAGRRIDVVGDGDADWRWLRLGVLQPDPDRPQDETEAPGAIAAKPEPAEQSPYRFREAASLVDSANLPSGLERRLEMWLIEQAGRILTEADDQLRLTVPVAREITTGRAFAQRLFSVLERLRIPPSRMLFEIDESALVGAGQSGREFSRQLERIGSGVVVANSQGGWQAWEAMENLPILYIKPHAKLVERAANADLAANRILGAMVDNATGCDQELIAPPSNTPDAYLDDVGFTYRERIEPEL